MSFESVLRNVLNFRPEESIGPVAAAYYYSNAEVSAIMGPVGSAKTSTSVMKIFRHAILQQPNDQGIRYTKHTIIRDTYRELSSTTIKTWLSWIPKEMGEWKGGGSGEPASHHIRFKLFGDRAQGIEDSVVDMQVEFMAMGEHNAEDVLKGLETTTIYVNEADLVAPDVISYGRGRIGRYPSKDLGKPSWYGIFADLNAPDEDNYIADMFIYDKPEEFAFFRQPSGLSPDAENLANLPPNYYQKQMAKQTKDYVRRMIKNEIGYSRSGDPVYEEYSDDLHTAKQDLQPVPGIPLRIGMDAGLTPAAVIGQRLADGQWLILREIIGTGIGAYKFADELNRVLKDEFPGYKVISATCDPAASAKSSTDRDEKSWAQIVRNETGLPVQGAPTNNITPRIDCVKGVLTRLIDGKPGVLVSPKCKTLRRGFVSGYCMKDGLPDKNEYSHVHDGFQYLCLGGGEYYEVMHRQKERSQNSQPVIVNSSFKVL